MPGAGQDGVVRILVDVLDAPRFEAKVVGFVNDGRFVGVLI